MSEPVTIEQMETFEKQTFRNRCLIRDAKGELVRLTVPVGKVEHKQLTRDIQISYQTRWQHQHWITLVSAYQHTPYFLYFADYLRPFYEKEYKWLLDLNDELNATLISLINKQRPTLVESQKSKVESSKSNPWATGNEISRQMKLNRTIPEISGECFYSTRPLLRNPRGVCESIKAIYSQEKENSEYFLPWE